MLKPIDIDPDLKFQEAQRMLTIARRKIQAGDHLSQPLFRVESVQMYQQAMELCLKAIMTVLVEHFYPSHDFPTEVVQETLRAYQKEWPGYFEAPLEKSFRAANRWSSERVLGTYGYIYGSSGEVVISEAQHTQAREDAQHCLNNATTIINRYR